MTVTFLLKSNCLSMILVVFLFDLRFSAKIKTLLLGEV